MKDEFSQYRLPGEKLKAIRDRDHKQINRMHEGLRTAIIQGNGMERVLRCSEDLVRTTLLHFESEERAMDDGPLATQTAHQELHAELVETLEDLSEELNHRKISGAMALLKFFDGRLADHLRLEEAG